MVSSAYLLLLIFLPAILIPVYASSSWEFCVMYSAYKLNKQGDMTIYSFDLLLVRKVMTNLDSKFKSRDITLPNKIHLVISKETINKKATYWMGKKYLQVI